MEHPPPHKQARQEKQHNLRSQPHPRLQLPSTTQEISHFPQMMAVLQMLLALLLSQPTL